MTPSDLLDQFVVEARECLEAIGTRLLDVERDPRNPEILNDLFRSVHTLKGNCGLFEFKSLERVVHAGEDLLDRVRIGTMDYSPELADALLDAMDYSATLIDQIERTGSIDAGAETDSIEHAAALRALLGNAPTVAQPAPLAVAVTARAAPPDWLGRFGGEAAARDGALALRYVPDQDCFFKGEDPWRLAATTPGLQALRIDGRDAWPEGAARDAWDCYQCNLDIAVISTASRAEIDSHYACVAEQVAVFEWPSAVAMGVTAPRGEAALMRRAAVLWDDQLALLGRAGVTGGAVRAARRAFAGLLACRNDAPATTLAAELDALPDACSAAVLLDWAQSQAAGREETRAARMPAGERDIRSATVPAGSLAARADDNGSAPPQKVLKVAQEKIDRLMDLVGEMVVAKNSLPYLAQRAEEVFQQRELAREIKAQYAIVNRIAEDLQHAIMQVRMLPVGIVFQRFGRLVRDLSKKLGKDVELVIVGEETEADKNVIEPLADPLIHILRNSLDHGIELPAIRLAAGKPATGTIRIAARQESDRVIIEISDDGAGVNAQRVRAKAVERGLIPADRAETLSDEEAVQLVFLPGFSTADAISDLSGRGVGMDVVRNAVERINGAVELISEQGKGTTIRLTLPLSMAVTNVMVIESAGHRIGVPMDLIVETVRVHRDDVHRFKQAQTTVLRGRIVPLRALNEVLALDAEPLVNAEGELAVLVVRIGSENVGVLVDRFHGASDIILKPLEGVLAGLVGFAGTALMGDGSVLMVLNPKELF